MADDAENILNQFQKLIATKQEESSEDIDSDKLKTHFDKVKTDLNGLLSTIDLKFVDLYTMKILQETKRIKDSSITTQKDIDDKLKSLESSLVAESKNADQPKTRSSDDIKVKVESNLASLDDQLVSHNFDIIDEHIKKQNDTILKKARCINPLQKKIQQYSEHIKDLVVMFPSKVVDGAKWMMTKGTELLLQGSKSIVKYPFEKALSVFDSLSQIPGIGLAFKAIGSVVVKPVLWFVDIGMKAVEFIGSGISTMFSVGMKAVKHVVGIIGFGTTNFFKWFGRFIINSISNPIMWIPAIPVFLLGLEIISIGLRTLMRTGSIAEGLFGDVIDLSGNVVGFIWDSIKTFFNWLSRSTGINNWGNPIIDAISGIMTSTLDGIFGKGATGNLFTWIGQVVDWVNTKSETFLTEINIYSDQANQFLSDFSESKITKALTTGVKWIMDMLSEWGPIKNLSQAVVGRFATNISSYLTHALRQKWTTANPPLPDISGMAANQESMVKSARDLLQTKIMSQRFNEKKLDSGSKGLSDQQIALQVIEEMQKGDSGFSYDQKNIDRMIEYGAKMAMGEIPALTEESLQKHVQAIEALEIASSAMTKTQDRDKILQLMEQSRSIFSNVFTSQEKNQENTEKSLNATIQSYSKQMNSLDSIVDNYESLSEKMYLMNNSVQDLMTESRSQINGSNMVDSAISEYDKQDSEYIASTTSKALIDHYILNNYELSDDGTQFHVKGDASAIVDNETVFENAKSFALSHIKEMSSLESAYKNLDRSDSRSEMLKEKWSELFADEFDIDGNWISNLNAVLGSNQKLANIMSKAMKDGLYNLPKMKDGGVSFLDGQFILPLEQENISIITDQIQKIPKYNDLIKYANDKIEEIAENKTMIVQKINTIVEMEHPETYAMKQLSKGLINSK